MYTIYCKLRDERKLKDSDISKATGISKSTFSDWKSGRSKPKIDKIKTLADFFGVSVEHLMGAEYESLSLADVIYMHSTVDIEKLADDSELSEAKQELIDFVISLQEDAADSMLRMMKAYYEEWQRNQR